MAIDDRMITITVQAGQDLSTKQNRFMVMASDGQIDPVGTAGADADGVLVNAPEAAGRAATLAIGGVAKVILGTGGITAGAKVRSDANGAAVATASGSHVLGKALKAGAAGEIVPVLLKSNHILA